MERLDVLIIGAGVTGAMIARNLAKYDLKVALLVYIVVSVRYCDSTRGHAKGCSDLIYPKYIKYSP